MNDRSRRVLHLVAGIYLVYLGIRLIKEQLNAPTSNATIAWIGAVLFLICGIYFALTTIRKFVKDFHEQEADESGDLIEDPVETVEESAETMEESVEMIEEKEEIEE